jgi:uncharacterized membrane protein
MPIYFDTPAHGTSRINVGTAERILSGLGGGMMAAFGLSRGSAGGYLLAAAGGALLFRGISGYCPALGALGISTADDIQPEPVEIERSVTVMAPRAEVYSFWRRLENLPRFMEHLEEVRGLGGGRSRWTARVPKGMGTIEWEAEVVKERENELLAWRSLPGADVDNAGLVVFKDAPGNRGTEVHVTIDYRPPIGAIGRQLGSWLNPILGQMVKEDIRRFKHLMEAGEVPTTEGQPQGN